MEIKHKILRYLIEKRTEKFSINALSKALLTDYKPIHTNINKLIKNGSVCVEERGNTRLCYFSQKFDNDVFFVENERKNELIKNKDFLIIYNRLKNVNKQFILLVFGSYVKGNIHKNSDIDLMLISDDEANKDVEKEIRILPHKIHLNSFNYTEFMQMLKSNEFSVVSEAIKNNVVLIGVEDYYRLKQNAR